MKPLEGIKVIELAQNLAGPFCGQILSHLGAEVIKVERPGTGDDARGWGPPFIDGSAAAFHAVNLNKNSLEVDFGDPEALSRLKELIQEQDVLVQNLRPGVVEKLGLDGASLRASHPRLIYCSLSAFGHTGPMRRHPGYEPMVQAFSGLMMLSGEEQGPPIRIGTQILDHGTGMWAAIGILAGLQQRTVTGQGVIVDTSLFETAMGWLTIHYGAYAATGSLPPRHPSGSARVVVFQAFDTQNGPMVVAAANDRLFAKLAQALGKPEWVDDPRFSRNADRVQHRDLILPEITAIMKTRTRGQWLDILTEAGVPAAPVQTVPEMLDSEQAQAIGMLKPIPGENRQSMGLPINFNGHRPDIRKSAPRLGESGALKPI